MDAISTAVLITIIAALTIAGVYIMKPEK